MRKLVLVLLMVLAVSASAQIDKPTRVSLFLTNPGFGWSEGGGGFFDAGVGVAFEHRFTPRWSAEVEVAREEHDHQPSIFDPMVIEFRTYPIDAFVRYSFQSTHVRWRPFIGAGARYVSAPDEPQGADYDSQLSPEIGAGIEWEAGDSWSLVLDAKALTRNDVPNWDELIKISAGIGWRF